MRAETKEAMRMFLGGRCYTAKQLEKDYLSEVAGYSDDRWEAPQRAARLAAAVKRYKPQRCCVFIFATIAYDPDPDLTPLAVRRLCQALFGRTGSQWLIVEIFGVKDGSTAAMTALRRPLKKWQPDIVTPQGCTGRQLWRKLSG
ncbi:YadA [Klebsiella pneumoniae]|uniref:YadA n=1 Tax=Klebsiella pneumoniae TaxID=573 RepID=A0A2X3BPI4_KLEPN|nr:YadA [Klebsiella pneumoniae]